MNPSNDSSSGQKLHVIAYFMHEDEEANAIRLLDPAIQGNEGKSPIQRTHSFVMGDATPSEVEELRNLGLIIQQVETRPVMEGTEPSMNEVFSVEESQAAQRYLLQMAGPMLPDRRDLLAKYGVTLVEALPNDLYRVDVTPEQCEDVAMLPFVVAVRSEKAASQPVLEQLQIPDTVIERSALVEMSGTEDEPTPFDLWLTEGADRVKVQRRLERLGVRVVAGDGRKIRVLVVSGSDLHRKVSAMPEVEIMEEYLQPDWHNAHARRIMGLTSAGPAAVDLPWDGSGQIVAVADTGLDDGHPDFAGRIVSLIALGRPGRTDDPHGHGTHVSGSVLGDGTASKAPGASPSSTGPLKGAAPAARLFFQSVLGPPTLSNQFPLSGLPVALETLFDQAYQAGARIHNNSWGSFAKSFYRMSSREVDDYVHKNRDMLVVISAGNEGSTANPPSPARRNSGPGLVDWYSVGAPATSKNGLTVGASQSDISSGGFSHLTHNAVWPTKFPPVVPPMPGDAATQNVSGDASEMAGFSSRGPGAAFQIKPDLVAPGTDIVSARSSLAPAHHFSGPYAGNPNYGHMCGTSMAAPLVSGCAAVVRQFLQQVKKLPEPSAALVKAMLVNGTRLLTGFQATATPGGFPNSHQGFGCIDMATTLPTPWNSFDLHLYDNWKVPETHLSSLDRQRFRFTLGSSVPWLRICMSYTDRPGNGVQNAMLMLLHHIPTKQKWMSNEGQLASLSPSLPFPDRANNTGIIRLANPEAGDYVLQISPQNLPFGGTQDFALVVSAPGITTFNLMSFNG